jgi:hypothetical protein
MLPIGIGLSWHHLLSLQSWADLPVSANWCYTSLHQPKLTLLVVPAVLSWCFLYSILKPETVWCVLFIARGLALVKVASACRPELIHPPRVHIEPKLISYTYRPELIYPAPVGLIWCILHLQAWAYISCTLKPSWYILHLPDINWTYKSELKYSATPELTYNLPQLIYACVCSVPTTHRCCIFFFKECLIWLVP